jgi:hypothetical protein
MILVLMRWLLKNILEQILGGILTWGWGHRYVVMAVIVGLVGLKTVKQSAPIRTPGAALRGSVHVIVPLRAEIGNSSGSINR